MELPSEKIKLVIMKSSSRILFWTIAAPMVFTVYWLYMRFFCWHNFYYLLGDMPKRPYVYRALTIYIIKALSLVASYSVETYAHILIFISFVGFLISIRAMASFYWNEMQREFITALSAFALMPLMFENEHIYDIPALFLFTLALALMQRERWKTFLWVFTLASLNKETSILLTVVFGAVYWKQRDRKFWSLSAAQIAIYSVVRAAVMFAFRSNPGVVMETHFFLHVSAIWRNPVGSLILFAFLGFVLYAISKGFKTSPLFLRRAIVILPILYILYLVGGAPFEIRVFYEAFPIIFLLCVCAVIRPAA